MDMHIIIDAYVCIIVRTYVLLAGPEAKKTYEAAQVMLEKIVTEDLLKAHGIVGLFPASAEGDDITVYDEEGSKVIGKLHGLRQQVCTIFLNFLSLPLLPLLPSPKMFKEEMA